MDAIETALNQRLIEAYRLQQAGKSNKALDICWWLRRQPEASFLLRVLVNITIITIYVIDENANFYDYTKDWENLVKALDKQPDGSKLTEVERGLAAILEKRVSFVAKSLGKDGDDKDPQESQQEASADHPPDATESESLQSIDFKAKLASVRAQVEFAESSSPSEHDTAKQRPHWEKKV